jgi:hypothetical protein
MLIIKWETSGLYDEGVSFNYGIKKRKRCNVSGVLTAPTYWRIKTKHETAETGQSDHAGE